MSKLFLHMMISLDGYIEGPNKDLNWHFVDEEYEKYSIEMLSSIDAILVGRNVYQLFVDYWPTAAQYPVGAVDPVDPTLHLEAADILNELPKHVVSKTLKHAEWNNSHIIHSNISEEIGQLKQLYQKDIALFGGAKLANGLMNLNLIDEYRLIINPIVLGDGTPLFKAGINKTEFKLTDTYRFKSGALISYYQPKIKIN